ncbi:MAG: hypothetical protein U0871_10955 [Gemmataceae bacterium]
MAHVQRLCSSRSAYALATLTLLLAGSRGHAQQFVLFDATFTKEDADTSKPSKSHYYVRGKMLNADRPKDWAGPVDYVKTLVPALDSPTYEKRIPVMAAVPIG